MKLVGCFLFALFCTSVFSETDLGGYDDASGKNTEIVAGTTTRLNRYRIVKATGVCERFDYKGKGMDFNNFKTLEECENHKNKPKDDVYKAAKAAVVASGQTSAPSESLCTGVAVNKYFLKKSSSGAYTCDPFQYKGCAGGNNFFDTVADCNQAIAALTTSTHVINRFSCGIHPEVKDTLNNAIRVIADMTMRKCVHAVVNEDEKMGVFESIQQCTGICLSRPIDMNPKCNSRVSQMKCGRNLVQRYYYNKFSKTCHMFETEDCKYQQSANIFETFDDCIGSCPTYPSRNTEDVEEGIRYKKANDICRLSRSEGIGHLFLARHYFDRHTSSCLPFVYRGIGGNDNRFMTKEECLAVCSGANTEIAKPPTVVDPSAVVAPAEPTVAPPAEVVPEADAAAAPVDAAAVDAAAVDPTTNKTGDGGEEEEAAPSEEGEST